MLFIRTVRQNGGTFLDPDHCKPCGYPLQPKLGHGTIRPTIFSNVGPLKGPVPRHSEGRSGRWESSLNVSFTSDIPKTTFTSFVLYSSRPRIPERLSLDIRDVVAAVRNSGPET